MSWYILSFFSLKMIYMVYWEICNAHIEVVWDGTVVEIVRAHISQQNFVHTLGALYLQY